MQKTVRLTSEPVLDPRGQMEGKQLKLAPRLGSLKGKHVVLFDNTKLAFGQYREIFPVVEERFRQEGVDQFSHLRRNLRGEAKPLIMEVAHRIRSTGAHAAVLAIADMGVTPATTILAVELERMGMPVAIITAGPGIQLSRVVAAYRLTELALCPLEVFHGSPKEEVIQKTKALCQTLVDVLTLPPEQLQQHFQSQPATGGVNTMPGVEAREGQVRLKDELILLTAERDGGLTASLDPAAFAERYYEEFCAAHIGDGLPIIPPTRERVERMLSSTDRRSEEVLLEECSPSGVPITVAKVAVNAVLAGCKPEYFPVVLVAMEAMMDPAYAFLQAATTSHPSGYLVLVSGPIARELGIHAGAGCLGPGFRANATIGRAIDLCVINICRAVPGLADLASQSSPAKYAYCFAENEEDSPWPALHTELFNEDTTAVTVLKCEAPHDVVEFMSTTPEDILEVVASATTSLGTNNAYMPSNLVVALAPDHARIIGGAGWSKDQVRRFLFEKARNPREALEGRGIMPLWPHWFRGLSAVPIVERPEDIIVVVAGGPGPHSMVAPPWGLNSRAVTRPIARKDGKPVRSVKDLLQG